jgi:hypothetical protein
MDRTEDAYTEAEGSMLRGCIPGPKGSRLKKSILRNPNSHGQNYDAALALTRKNRYLHLSDFLPWPELPWSELTLSKLPWPELPLSELVMTSSSVPSLPYFFDRHPFHQFFCYSITTRIIIVFNSGTTFQKVEEWHRPPLLMFT